MINQFLCGQNGDAFEVTNATQRDTDGWFYDWATGGGRSAAGVAVNGYTALTLSPLWQGINIIAGDIGQTPVSLVRNIFDDASDHPASRLLRLRPNGLQNPCDFLETIVQWALMWGRGVAWIQRRGSQPFRLVPLRPDCLWRELVDFEGEEILLYHYYSPLRSGRIYTFFPWEVIDLHGLTSDGVCGYELHRVARKAIAHGLALEEHGNSTFANGAVPGGVLESPVGNGISKSKEARDNLRSEWNALHRGPDKSGSIAILWEGITYKAMAHTNIDAQWIEAKNLSRQEVAGLLGLPPHKLGDLRDSSVRSNLEEQNADYVQRTLSRWYTKLSQEFRRKLLTEKEWMSGEYEFVWDHESFLKPDIDTMTSVLDRLVKATILNPNEARAKLRLRPREGGEEYGSPAINPNKQQPEDGAESPDNGRPEAKFRQDTGVSAHKELIFDRVLHLIEREGISLRQAAKQSANFVRWLDEFYLQSEGGQSQFEKLSDTMTGTAIKACLAAGLDVRGINDSLAKYAAGRHKQCLSACEVTANELPAAIERVIGNDQILIAQGLLATAIGGQLPCD